MSTSTEIDYVCDTCGQAWASEENTPCPDCGAAATPAWKWAARDPHNWAGAELRDVRDTGNQIIEEAQGV